MTKWYKDKQSGVILTSKEMLASIDNKDQLDSFCEVNLTLHEQAQELAKRTKDIVDTCEDIEQMEFTSYDNAIADFIETVTKDINPDASNIAECFLNCAIEYLETVEINLDLD